MSAPQVRARAVVVKEFNEVLGGMLRKIMTKYPTDNELEKARSKIAHAKAVRESILITTAGPFLLKYQAKIAAGDESILYSGELEKEAAASPDGQYAVSMFSKLREYYKSFKAAEKKDILRDVNRLLDDYLEYLLGE